MGNNRGLLIGFKGGAAKNYIDVSKYFEKVYVASFTTINNDDYYQLFNTKKITDDMKVVFGYIKYASNGRVISNEDSKEPSENIFVPCNYFIVGELK